MCCYYCKQLGLLLLLLCMITAEATTLSSIKSSDSQTHLFQINWRIDKPLRYRYRLLTAPHRLVVDLQRSQHADSPRLTAAALRLVKRHYQDHSPYRRHTRWIFELRQPVTITVVTRAAEQRYPLCFILKPLRKITSELPKKPVISEKSPEIRLKKTPTLHPSNKVRSKASNKITYKKIIVTIDAGHGGKDPGAIGPAGLQEKQVNLAIAKRLALLLQRDRQFSPVLTRDTDTFIAVGERSAIARQHKAQLLISIHADGAMNPHAHGASVWVLSNQRANNELTRWLSPQLQGTQLIGGVGSLLAQKHDPYVHHALLDLQFSHSQQVGYLVASAVLKELEKLSPLHKCKPEYASLGVLQSPDIPSLLVEGGFITNAAEERLLRSAAHQQQVAMAIYRGIKHYFQKNPPVKTTPVSTLSRSVLTLPSRASVPSFLQSAMHVVQPGETLFSIATRHRISCASLQQLNRLPSNQLRIGQKLRVPTAATKMVKQ